MLPYGDKLKDTSRIETFLHVRSECIAICTPWVALSTYVRIVVVVVVAFLATCGWRSGRGGGEGLLVLATDGRARVLISGSWPAFNGLHARGTRHLRGREARHLLLWSGQRPDVWLVHPHVTEAGWWSGCLLLWPYTASIPKARAELQKGRGIKMASKNG